MAHLQRILCPTDFSECAHQAFAQALLLAKQLDAELHTLHAIVLHESDPYNPAYHFPNSDEAWHRLSKIATSEMTDLVKLHQQKAVEVRQVQKRGTAAGPVILEYTKEHDIDLIIMGTHGLRGARRFFLGSVTEEVMRFAECPVLTLREKTRPRPHGSMQTLLAPVDFSENSKSSWALAKQLAHSNGAHLHLTYVLEARHYAGFWSVVGDDLVPNADELKGLAEEKLRRLAEEVPGPAVSQEFHVSIGRSISEILSLATKIEADLIVVGSQGHSPLEDLMLGSTAEGIVRRASCPVLTVKAPSS